MTETEIIYLPFTSPDQIVKFPSNVLFRVYYLEAPLGLLSLTYEGGKFLNNFVNINGFHTGVGFQSLDCDEPYEITFDHIMKNGFNLTSLLPTIVNGDLVWNNQMQINIGNYIDKHYWERSTYICTITSEQLTIIQNWILNTWIPKNPIYSLFSGSKSSSTQDLFNPIFRPSICDTFAYAMFNYIADTNGGLLVDPVNTGTGFDICIEYVTVPNVSISAFIGETGTMVPVDYESNKQEIITFYEAFLEEVSELEKVTSDIEKLIEQIRNDPNLSPDEKNALIWQLVHDVFTFINIIAEAYLTFETIYYYGYSPDNVTPGYWKMTKPKIELTYTNSNLKRSYNALSYDGKTVEDAYTVPKSCKCVTPVPSEEEPITSGVTSDEGIPIWVWIIVGIIILIIIIVIFVIIFTAGEN